MQYSRYVQIHWLITLSVGSVLRKARVATFDLDTAASFLLNVLDICASVTDYLCPQVESRNWLKVNGDAFFGPFALGLVSCEESGTRLYVLDQTHHAPPDLVPYV